MIHITNGDMVARKIQLIFPNDVVVPWREINTEGPICLDPRDLSEREYRSHWLASELGIPSDEYLINHRKQLALLDDVSDTEELCLWFEYDLFDQSILWEICVVLIDKFEASWFDQGHLSLVTLDSFDGINEFHGLGQLDTHQLKSLFPKRIQMNREMTLNGADWWERFALGNVEITERISPNELPFARAAFQFHILRKPDEQGLGIVERTILQVVLEGNHSWDSCFHETSRRLLQYGMGDLQFKAILKRMKNMGYTIDLIDK